MTESHQRILMDTELLIAARKGDESRFARVLGLEEDTSEITINTDNRCIARDEQDFFLGVTYTGNSLLHLAASSNFLDLAEKIWRRETSLLVARNKVLETPLHCAAKNGNCEMVSLFIGFAYEMGEDIVKVVLRARNKDGETALHDAARHNHTAVASLLINADPGLASVMDHQGMSSNLLQSHVRERQRGGRETEKERETEKTGSCYSSRITVDFHPQGISPLYLATTLGYLDVVHEITQGLIGIEVSKAYYAGPDGQTALHAAVLRSKEMTEKLLAWKPLLAKMPDNSGSTPLHFAASHGYDEIARLLLKCDHSLAYLHDSCGSFPVHVAAKMGHAGVIKAIYCADSDELLDVNGRNFLHIAAQEGRSHVVESIGHTTKHKSMKNARDNEGNTPLHLAMDSGHEMVVKLLMQDKQVSLNICNKRGLTLRDQSAIATFNDHAIYPLNKKANFWLKESTEMLGAYYGARRLDQFVEDHSTKVDEEKENEELTSAIQTLGLGSVLISTATFAAAFTMPGGYRADDHPKSGLPTLGDKYAFKAFLISDMIAFICAFHSTIILLYRGVTSSKPRLKKLRVSQALCLIILASRFTLVSFSFAIFLAVAPVNMLLGIIILIMGGVLLQYDGIVQDHNFIIEVMSSRQNWMQLFHNKLPEARLRKSLAAGPRYARSIILDKAEIVFPVVFTAVVPLIMDLVWHFGKSVVTYIVSVLCTLFI